MNGYQILLIWILINVIIVILIFTISIDRCDGSFNTVEDPFGTICVSKKIGDVNFEVFNIIKGIN